MKWRAFLKIPDLFFAEIDLQASKAFSMLIVKLYLVESLIQSSLVSFYSMSFSLLSRRTESVKRLYKSSKMITKLFIPVCKDN